MCSFCGGPFHPSTGHAYSETYRACGPCTRSFWAWVRRHTSMRLCKVYFYEAAVKFGPPYPPR